MESARAGRTRYLVVVSRSIRQRRKSQSLNLTSGSSNLDNGNESALLEESDDSKDSGRLSQDEAMDGKEMTEISDNEIINAKEAIAEEGDTDAGDPPKEGVEGGNALQAETDELDRRMSTDCGSFETANQEEDQEESCLLGIDCNEQSTVGLVLRIYADTKIHLDGDG